MDPDDRKSWRAGLDLAAVGIEMAVSVLVGWYAGSWLDGRLDTTPWFMVAGVAVGSAAGFRAFWRAARRNWPR
jgi:ATP synthase protein I